ncbi:MAG: family 20 glycosylhydrolase [Eubacterium sp.]|nr:family 20 glycosylhydrolase [Candidatus Colimonas fimequi]
MLKKTVALVSVFALMLTLLFTIEINPVYAEGGSFTLDSSSRIYIVSKAEPQEKLVEAIELVDSQMAAVGIPGDTPMTIAYGSESKAKAGDIIVKVDSDVEKQGYKIETTGKNLKVSASTVSGMTYGLDYILQQFMVEGNTVSIDVSDSPDAVERTVLLDCGRKYYSRQWIENFIKRMSWQKYTALELHFSDTHGMRFESKTFPWLNEPEGEYLTYEDLQSICQVARQYHIELIPEIDSPGHLDYVIEKYADYVAKNPDFSFEYDGVTYDNSSEGFGSISNYYMYNGAKSSYNNTGIDLANPVAVAFISALIDEYADFFAKEGSRNFNIGGDELFGWKGTTVGGKSFDMNSLWSAMEHWEHHAQKELGIENGSAADTFISYLNSTGARLAEKGYTCRVWNDELHRAKDQHVELDPSIEIVYWTNDYTPMSQLASNGNKIHNTNTGWCYYVIREDKHGGDIMDKTRKRCNARNIYENWDIHNCANPKDKALLIPEETYAGGYFAMWADSPDYKDAAQVWDDTYYRTWANSAKLWDNKAQESATYDEYKAYVDTIGCFPGYSGDSEVDSVLPECGELVSELGFMDKVKAFFAGLFT